MAAQLTIVSIVAAKALTTLNGVTPSESKKFIYPDESHWNGVTPPAAFTYNAQINREVVSPALVLAVPLYGADGAVVDS
jgi:hypothetical protein